MFASPIDTRIGIQLSRGLPSRMAEGRRVEARRHLDGIPVWGYARIGWRHRPLVAGWALRYHPRETAKIVARGVVIPPSAGQRRERHDRALGATEEADGQSVEADLHGEPGRSAGLF